MYPHGLQREHEEFRNLKNARARTEYLGRCKKDIEILA
jgi:hypothetical protein